MMIGFQADVTGLTGKDNWLEMYTGRDIAPGFFAWVIPTVTILTELESGLGRKTSKDAVWSSVTKG